MPAKSAAQQKAAGAALSAKRGDTPKSKLKGASKSMMSMSEKELEKMAHTKRKGKPEHVEVATRLARPALPIACRPNPRPSWRKSGRRDDRASPAARWPPRPRRWPPRATRRAEAAAAPAGAPPRPGPTPPRWPPRIRERRALRRRGRRDRDPPRRGAAGDAEHHRQFRLRPGARQGAAPATPTGPFGGVPFLIKDLDRLHGPAHPQRARSRRACAGPGHQPGPEHQRLRPRRPGDHRQVGDAGVRLPADHRAAGHRPDPQPLGPDALLRRLLRRVGRGRGGRRRARRPTPPTAAARSASRPRTAASSA